MVTVCLKSNVAESAAQRSGDWLGIVIVQSDLDDDRRRCVVSGQWQGGCDEWILDGHRPAVGQVDVAPDAGVAAANGGNPIPADGSVIGGIVRAQRAAVLAGDSRRSSA